MNPPNPTGDPAAPGHPEEGLSILDLASLSGPQLHLMRIILRESTLSEAAFRTMIDSAPVAERISRELFEATLRDLLEKEWLLETNDASGTKVYKANLRRKSSRTVSDFVAPRSRRGGTSSSLRNIWDSIEKDDK